ncbi:patatin family protein [Paraliobacillus quinghaiensis]|uniref:Patatin family protein n=1 Tax=Paraliobacillus quinghaiensis TaxID=470815 RepID=A0A917TEN0_9BACI|nr:patatin family protein [Paraliobacillus quinghaiensis]GGM20108.1 patatin family protein [Paraliobacillus quinghaiensis]
MDQVGLILEGGGMRGTYSAGVLDFFYDKGIDIPYVVGTSAGACVATSYLSKQRNRNYKVFVEYGSHPEYISYKRLIKKGQLFGMDFIFDTIPNKLVPFDFETFQNNNSKLVIGTTDIVCGESVFYDTFNSKEELLKVVRASSSIPFVASSISYNGRELMDGGISTPIPIDQSIEAGNKKHVIILTRNKGYLKNKLKFIRILRKKYKQYPGLVKALEERHGKYNETLEKINKMEKNKEAFVIRPEKPLKVSRIETNKQRLHDLYIQGYHEAESKMEQLQHFLNK